jgi:gamma-glutamyltranspeptidase/glutathione hydrolase
VGWLYRGRLGAEVVDTVANPPIDPTSDYNARPGLMQRSDLAAYDAPFREPTHVGYRGLDVYGMAPPSSGGSTVGEALNILENADLDTMTRTQALHHYLEASALSFADRNEYVGDPAYVDVPLDELLSEGFAKERFCVIDPEHALPKPQPAGSPDGSYNTNCEAPAGATATRDHEGLSTSGATSSPTR